MRQVKALVNRFPRHELAIHRLYIRDTMFKTICGDYEDAQRALQYWQSGPSPSARNVRQYRQILKDLEVELLEMIESTLTFACPQQDASSAPTALPLPRRQSARG